MQFSYPGVLQAREAPGTRCPRSAVVSGHEAFPCTAVQVPRHRNAKKSGIAPSHGFPELSGKGAEGQPDGPLSPPGTRGRVEQAAFPA